MKKLFAAAALAPLALVGLSLADTASTASPILSEIKAGQPMRMEYQIKANAWVLFLPISAKANFSVDMTPDNYMIRGKVKTTGLADILVNYDMDLAASGYTTPEGLKSYAFASKNHDGKKNRKVDLKYLADGFEMTAVPAFGNLGDPAATPEQVLETKDPITSLISFALEPRAPGADPCGGPMKVFDGRQLTHLTAVNKGLKSVKSDAWSGKAYECHIKMTRVAGYKKGEVNRETLTGIAGPIRMWLAPMPNGATVPVRIEVDTDKIGKVTLQAAKLSFTPIE